MLKHQVITVNVEPDEPQGRVHHIPIQYAVPRFSPTTRIPPIPRPSLRSTSSLSPAGSQASTNSSGSAHSVREVPIVRKSSAALLNRPPGASNGILKTRGGTKMGGDSNPVPTLPISMEDTELFPKHKFGINDHPALETRVFSEMRAGLNKIWWSRLITATRGYVINAFKHDDEILFLFDDTFILIHEALVEKSAEDALQLVSDILTLEREGCEALQTLEQNYSLEESRNPFFHPNTRAAYRRLFGDPESGAYGRAFRMGFAFLVFFNVLARIGGRWEERKGKPKGIKFAEDPEWHPDARVVLFQEMAGGNRAWVVCEYDRHLIAFWRPKGVNVIFGDRYIQSKKEEGFRLCSFCGILESFVGEHRSGRALAHGQTAFCSEGCEKLHGRENRH